MFYSIIGYGFNFMDLTRTSTRVGPKKLILFFILFFFFYFLNMVYTMLID